ncbi:hypothetical protein MHC_03580 [Mycoplasma haemocanis str. Illinois]|uniref:Lipoprotein n=1 Tax=Mycoplasma haemocanis (strain Illinois) TaxID=1111676 RepID=H6N7F4_MYCHN|nr:hypothetical protein [Mycoplasma haemocanis]AEW45576.1 hypothetical protein MHC_03580 [Mycoplasma haemocanis str. Illinois]
MSKYVLALGSVGAVGCATTAGVVYLKSTNSGITLEEKFRKEIKGKILLDVSSDRHDSVWGELVEEYKKFYKDKVDLEGLSKDGLDKEKFKAYCRRESQVKEENRFSSYVEWCSRNTLRTQFNDKVDNKSWIDSKEEKDWSDKKNNYPQDNNGNLQIPQESGGVLQKDKVTWQQIRDWCFSKVDIPFINGQSEDYKRAESLCVK